jgi:hypothetical protein
MGLTKTHFVVLVHQNFSIHHFNNNHNKKKSCIHLNVEIIVSRERCSSSSLSSDDHD